MPTASTRATSVINTSDWRAAERALLRSRLPRLKATTTVVPRSTAAKKEIITMLKLSASPTPAIASLPIQLTKKVLSTPISRTQAFSIKIGTASGVISRQNRTR
ncbi:hypothetical protein D3C78_1490020 [compost metagenome]